jgi:hypothetical protein
VTFGTRVHKPQRIGEPRRNLYLPNQVAVVGKRPFRLTLMQADVITSKFIVVSRFTGMFYHRTSAAGTRRMCCGNNDVCGDHSCHEECEYNPKLNSNPKH